MPMVNIRETESFDVALRRFKRACEKAGIPSKLRQIEFYEKPAEKRKRRKAAAVKRHKKKLFKETETMERERAKRTKALPTHKIITAQATKAEQPVEA